MRLKPIIPLVADTKETRGDTNKEKCISIDVKARVGGPEDSAKHKKCIRQFDEGTPQEWIDLMHDVQEIWRQNSVRGPSDRCSTIRALMKGETLTTFEAALSEARTNAEGGVEPVTVANVDTAIEKTATVVFPHRALETQK